MGRSKVLFAALFLFLMVTVADAYTVVLRDGRRVEIPNQFAVTNSTLTYAMGNGIQVTIQLNTVDIAATERANGESPGAFLIKGTEAKVSVDPASQTRRAGTERSITNQDLEKYKLARVASEKDREELGLPSIEDRRRETEAIEDRAMEQVRNMQAQEDAYWRGRADALRPENQTQLRQGSQDIPWSYSSGPFLPFDGAGFGITSGPFGRFRRFSPSPFDGFLATPITPFPRFPLNNRRRVFVAPGVRINTRPNHIRHR
jgi:hypothetical protein